MTKYDVNQNNRDSSGYQQAPDNLNPAGGKHPSRPVSDKHRSHNETKEEADKEDDLALLEPGLTTISLKFLLSMAGFTLFISVVFLAVYKASTLGFLKDSWKGIGLSEFFVKASQYGNLATIALALGAIFVTYLTLQQKKFADQRTAFYNRFHWALDKLASEDGQAKDTAYKIANRIWITRVSDNRDKDLMPLYNRFLHDLYAERSNNNQSESNELITVQASKKFSNKEASSLKSWDNSKPDHNGPLPLFEISIKLGSLAWGFKISKYEQ